MTDVPTTISAVPPGQPRWTTSAGPSLGVTANPLAATIATAVSFGLLPALIWPWRWATLLDRDRPYYRDLAVWWQRRVAPVDAKQLDAVLNDLRPRPILMVLPWLAAAFAALAVGGYAANYDPVWRHLIEVTFGRHQPPFHFRPLPLPGGDRTHLVWEWALGFAYACQWYAVRSHGRAVGQLVHWTNKVARDNGLGRVRNEAARLGLGPIWVVAAVGLCYAHAWWAIPMAVAGAAQRRYAMAGTPRLQQALATQASQALAISGGDGRPDRFCPTSHCGQRLPAPAQFCPRCGTATVPMSPGVNVRA